MKRIFIIGYMASGKTTFGRALAKEMGWDFIDLDFYIEQRFRKSVREIFASEGEEGFRRKEKAMLREAGEFENTIISCGGGTPCFHDNMDYMKSLGTTVYLDTNTDVLVRRLVENNSRRPLMAGKAETEIREEVEKGLLARMKFYSEAEVHFPGNLLENRSQINETVKSFITRYILNSPD